MRIRKAAVQVILFLGTSCWSVASEGSTSAGVVAWGNNEAGQTNVPARAQSGVIAVAAGSVHSVALRTDGSVIAWGDNSDGQATVPVAAQSGVTAIAAGFSHTVALKADGSVLVWGNYAAGQAGAAVPADAQRDVNAIAAGGYQTVVLKTDGSVLAWEYDELGPTTLPLPALTTVTAVAAGGYHILFLLGDGSVRAWGAGMINDPSRLVDYGQSIIPPGLSGVTAIAAGEVHSVALKNDGSVVAWGNNDLGQTDVPAAARSGVTAIAAGGSHTIALKQDGTIVAWGYNRNGEVTGTPSTNNPPGYTAKASPVTLNGQVVSGVTAIAAGGMHTVVASAPLAPRIILGPVTQTVATWQRIDFTVEAVGHDLNYQWRRDGIDIPAATNRAYTPFAQTNLAGSYTVVVSNTFGSVTSSPPAVLTVVPPAPGSVLAWGAEDYDYGQTTVPVAARSGVIAIAAGFTHTVALKADGSVVAWGDNAVGQTTVPLEARSGVIAVAAGWGHTLALKADGSVVAWGENGAGQSTVPLAARSRAIAIAAGWAFSMALKDDGTVVSWGLNEFYWETPVPAGLTGVTAIAGGGGHSLALKSDGSVYGWGGNDSGQVTGTRTTTPETNYVTLDGRLLGDVIAIAAGIESSIALRKDGSVVCWGRNDFGQSTAPGAAQSNVIAIAAGEVHSVALRADGTVLAWGNNNFGQVTGSPNLEVPYFGTASPVTLEGHPVNGVTAIAAGGLHTVVLLGTVTALQATRSGNNLVLTWPTQPAGFKLQSTSSLTPPVAWIDSSASPTNGNVTNLIKLQGGEFFRLRKP